MLDELSFSTLNIFLSRVPGIQPQVGTGQIESGGWYAKFGLNIDHKLAWHVVQEFAQVLNYLSTNERLPTVFKPVSPPPYLNGGPHEFLSWVIESVDPSFTPDLAAQWLQGRLSEPVEDQNAWLRDL